MVGGMAAPVDGSTNTLAVADITYSSACAPSRGWVVNDDSDNLPHPKEETKFVKRLREDGKGFEFVGTNQVPRLFAGGSKRNKKRAKAARKARKKNRK